MKLLYLSCHSVLEADEVQLFTNLGHYCFSPGSYVEPENPGDESMRPKPILPEQYREQYRSDMEVFHKLGKPGIDNKELLTKEFVDRFDAVIVMHLPKWITANWAVMKHKPVIWRTIGQSAAHNEAEMSSYRAQGLKIVRYSPREKFIPGYIGADALIRFYKDPEAFKGWTGENARVITIGQHLEKRGPPCNFKWLVDISAPFPRAFFGPGSESLGWGHGKISFSDLQKQMRENRVFLSGGTWPASYVMSFQEAWMTGIPVVAVGPKLGHPHGWFKNHDLYEVGDLISNGVNGWCSDDVGATQRFIKQLLDDPAMAKRIGDAGRAKAIEVFGKDAIMPQWDDFLKGL